MSQTSIIVFCKEANDSSFWKHLVKSPPSLSGMYNNYHYSYFHICLISFAFCFLWIYCIATFLSLESGSFFDTTGIGIGDWDIMHTTDVLIWVFFLCVLLQPFSFMLAERFLVATQPHNLHQSEISRLHAHVISYSALHSITLKGEMALFEL